MELAYSSPPLRGHSLEEDFIVLIRNVLVLSCSAVLFSALAAGAGAKTALDHAVQSGNCAPASRSLASHTRAQSPQTFDDYIEDTSGPDICGQNVITNDNEGLLTIGLHIHNRDGFAANEAYGVFFDTDLNPATGGLGAEYRVRLSAEGTVLGKWDGTKFPPVATLEPAAWQPGYGPVFRVRTADLGGAQSFRFAFFSTDGTNVDLAPNAGSWSYQLQPLALAIRGLALDRARAGRSFTARMSVLRSDLNAPLTEGTVACSAKVGTRVLAGTGSFAADRVVCAWRLPRNARHKRLSGSVAVTF